MSVLNKIVLKLICVAFVTQCFLAPAQGYYKESSNYLVDPAYTYINATELYLPEQKFNNIEEIEAYLESARFWSSIGLILNRIQ